MKRRRHNSTPKARAHNSRPGGQLDLAQRIDKIESLVAALLKQKTLQRQAESSRQPKGRKPILLIEAGAPPDAASAKKTGQQKSVVEFKHRTPVEEFRQIADRGLVLFQEDLEECIALRRVFHQAKKQMETKEKFIAAGIRANVAIEPGMYVPELRRAFRVRGGKPGYYFRLYIERK